MGKRRQQLKGELGRFLRQYARKHGSSDPNDRHYDRELEKKIKNMRPEELDKLMRDDDDEDEALPNS